jgi:hypothetical protein
MIAAIKLQLMLAVSALNLHQNYCMDEHTDCYHGPTQD